WLLRKLWDALQKRGRGEEMKRTLTARTVIRNTFVAVFALALVLVGVTEASAEETSPTTSTTTTTTRAPATTTTKPPAPKPPAPKPKPPAPKPPARDLRGLPANSGSGRRVVYSVS